MIDDRHEIGRTAIMKMSGRVCTELALCSGNDLFARTGAAISGVFQFHVLRCNRVVGGVCEKITAASARDGLPNVH